MRLLKWFWSKRYLRWSMYASLGFVVMSFVGIEVTSQSWFCNSCHIMNSYYHSWQTGSHKHVECVQCHIPPGATNYVWAKLNGLGQVVDDLLERSSTKPSASVSDASCTRSGCHAVSKVRTIARREGRYLFDHNKHLDLEYKGLELKCTTCHSHVQGDRHFEVNTNACVTCHLSVAPMAQAAPHPAQTSGTVGSDATASNTALPATIPSISTEPIVAASTGVKIAPNKCNNCHTPPAKPIEYRGMKVVHAEYLAYGAACESCHRGVTEMSAPVRDDHCFGCHDFGKVKLTDVTKLHHVHSAGEHKVECFSCHGVPKHGPSAQSMRLDQIDCQSCHHDQHAIQQKAYKSDPSMAHVPTDAAAVSPMFMSHVSCTGCHVQTRTLNAKPQSGATVAAATPKACDTCHKPGLGFEMVPLWQKNTHELYDAVAKLLPPMGQASGSPYADQLVADARHLLDLVRLDGSWGVHNPRYTKSLLEEAQKKLVEARSIPTIPKGNQP